MKVESKDFQAGSFSPGIDLILAEYTALMAMIDLFTLEMKNKLTIHFHQKKKGWDSPDTHPNGMVMSALQKAFGDMDWVSVANYAAILWNRQDD